MQTAIRAPGLVNEIIDAQRLEQNTLHRSSADTTDNVEPRFVEVMDTDTELNQENLYDAIQKELLDPPPAEPAKKTKRRAGAKNNKKTQILNLTRRIYMMQFKKNS